MAQAESPKQPPSPPSPPPVQEDAKGEGKIPFNQVLGGFGRKAPGAPQSHVGPDGVEYVSADEFFAQQYAEKQARAQAAQDGVRPDPVAEQPQAPVPPAEPQKDAPPAGPENQAGQEYYEPPMEPTPRGHAPQAAPIQDDPINQPDNKGAAPQRPIQEPVPGPSQAGYGPIPGAGPWGAPAGAWGVPPTGNMPTNGQPPAGWGAPQQAWNYTQQPQTPQWVQPEAPQGGWAPNTGAWANNGMPTGWAPPPAPEGHGADNYEDEDEDEAHVSPMDYLAQRQSRKPGKSNKRARGKGPSDEEAKKRKKFKDLANIDGYYNDRRPLDNEEDLDMGRNIAWVPLVLGVTGIALFAFVAIQLQGLL